MYKFSIWLINQLINQLMNKHLIINTLKIYRFLLNVIIFHKYIKFMSK